MTGSDNWRMQLTTPVAVLYGGHSAEREVSLQSGQAVLQALQSAGVEAVAIDTQQQDWLAAVKSQFQHAFIALHGGDGEDGTVQALLKHLGVSYTGSNTTASALAMDKVLSKFLWKGMELPSAPFEVLTAASDWQGIMDRFGKVMVKPATEGSSIGMSVASSAEELKTAFEKADQYKGGVLAEAWIEGAEFTASILGDRALPVIRLETDNQFYDYDAKYVSNDTRYLCPCGLSPEEEQRMQQLALQAFNSLGCSGWGRADFMQQDGEFYLLEVNTVPGMTSHSLVPMAAKAAGLNFEQLVLEILRLSIEGESS